MTLDAGEPSQDDGVIRVGARDAPTFQYTVCGVYTDSGETFVEHVFGENETDAALQYMESFDEVAQAHVQILVIFLGALYASASINLSRGITDRSLPAS